MKLSEKIATMVWAFASGDDRRYSVRQLADEVALLEARVLPVAHEHSPMVVDEAKPGDDRTVAVVMVDGQLRSVATWAPVDERKVAEAYREKVLAELTEWWENGDDTRDPHDVVFSVDLP